MPRKTDVAPEDAYQAYVMMGAQRSLKLLQQYYTRYTPNPPSLDTLKQWSRKYGWKQRFESEKQMAEARALEDLVKNNSEFMREMIARCTELCILILERVIKRQKKCEHDFKLSRADYYDVKSASTLVSLRIQYEEMLRAKAGG